MGGLYCVSLMLNFTKKIKGVLCSNEYCTWLKRIISKIFDKIKRKKNFWRKVINSIDLIKYDKLKELKKIVIANGNNSEEIKSFINNDLIINILKSNQEAKSLVSKEFVLFEKYYNKIFNKANYYKEIKIIHDFNECIQNIAHKRFFIVYENALKNINLKEKAIIYYFKYNKKSYIFFRKRRKNSPNNKR